MGVIFAKKTKAWKTRKLPPREKFRLYSKWEFFIDVNSIEMAIKANFTLFSRFSLETTFNICMATVLRFELICLEKHATGRIVIVCTLKTFQACRCKYKIKRIISFTDNNIYHLQNTNADRNKVHIRHAPCIFLQSPQYQVILRQYEMKFVQIWIMHQYLNLKYCTWTKWCLTDRQINGRVFQNARLHQIFNRKGHLIENKLISIAIKRSDISLCHLPMSSI